ncbi:MAG: cytosine methyltransferase [Herbaspirillum sp.]|nr:cytosine methyltransferase [Herbaspirillum sp.]
MKRDIFTLPLGLGDELIIDNFAGGGGTSTGLEQAFGRPVDIAINHDPEALAMHAANHPHTKHLCESVWDVDPIKVTGNQPVGLVWLSPDCKHFSKAKGGKPVEKKIRGLAWVTLRWAAKCKPRVIMLENVEEFKTWGPLLIDADGNTKPDPAKKGKTFDSFVRQLKGHGYDVDWRELRACDLDTPTIRKRFFLVARRDGIAIQWPAPTHGAPDSIGVVAGKLQPYRTAAECIDWSIPCPSIFERKKPLAEATLRRIAKGIMRYVVNSATPFIVGQGGPVYSGKPVSANQPFGTLTTENHRSVVVPSIVPVTHQGSDRTESIEEPFRTITGAHRGEKALVSAVLTGVGGRAGQSRPRGVDEPTATGTSKADAALVTASLEEVPTFKEWIAATGKLGGSREEYDRLYPVDDEPLGNAALVSAFLTEHANATGQRVMPADEPLRTVCAQVKGGHFSMVAAHITKFRTGATGSAMDEPLHTITAGPKENPAGAPHAMGIVTAHIESLYSQKGNEARASAADEPVKTVTASSRHALMASHLVKLRGTSNCAATDEPLSTVSAGGLHHAEVRAFLIKYYGTDQDPRLEEPLHTVTTKDRYGLVTINGQDYQIVDIGLRMLAPRELFRAQGFGDDYIIDIVPDWEKLFVDGQQVADINSIDWRPLTKSSQVRMCGNSVCPPMARALIQANFAHEREIVRAA